MRARPGEILGDRDDFTPVIGTVRGPIDRLPHVHRHQRRRLATPLKHQHPRGHVVKSPGAGARGAVVKAWQASPRTTSQHLSYLGREGKGGEAHHATLFTEEGQAVERRAFVREAKADPVQHRLIIAVHDHADVDLIRLTRALMTHIQGPVLHAPVAWVAAIHRDTAHPHIHLVLRGVDAHGRSVYFTRDTLQRSLRYQAQTLLTTWLGGTTTPVDHHDLTAWVQTHAKETKAMHDDATAVPTPTRTRTAPETTLARLDELHQRVEQLLIRLQARGLVQETLRDRPDEPERTTAPGQQATLRRAPGMER
jgi:hypothetical protein